MIQEKKIKSDKISSSIKFKFLDGVKIDLDVLKMVFNVTTRNSKKQTANTKTRGEIAGSNRKPWKQKGTGRARQGSVRSPIWIGGGITFGPSKEKNNHRIISRKTFRLSLKMIFKLYETKNKLVIVNEVPIFEKTKDAQKWLLNLKIESGRIIIVSGHKNNRGLRNIPYVSCININSLRIDQLILGDYLVISDKDINAIFSESDKK